MNQKPSRGYNNDVTPSEFGLMVKFNDIENSITQIRSI